VQPNLREIVLINNIPRNEIDVQTGHGRLHCVIQGEGDPLVLLHGALGTGTAHFREQIDEFSLSYKVIVPDLLGYGKSGHRDFFDEHFHQRDAEDVDALVRHLGLTRVHLCGFSDGAIVAMMVAGRYVDKVRSLVLIGGLMVLDEQTMKTTREWAPSDRLPIGFQAALARSHGDPYWRELVAEYVNASERLYQSGGNIVRDYLSGIACQTLIIQGESDPWVNPEHGKRLHESISMSELKIFTGAGHEVQREQPQAFNACVLSFLSAH
jgi:pimeloyl-ACP methyl ester carboxylesterase